MVWDQNGVVRAGPVALLVLGLLASCSDDPPRLETPDKEVCLDRTDGARYCIEVYEASRRDASASTEGVDNASPSRSIESVLPWVDITWLAARNICESKGKRLCEPDEWIDACDGIVGMDGLTYTYGDQVDTTRCNVDTGAPEAVGLRSTCASMTGTFDQSGNVWEWTGNTTALAAARGGGWRSTRLHGCKDTLMGVDAMQQSREIGFRCCRSE